jgi:Mrp family chromosome partitioning ATPase
MSLRAKKMLENVGAKLTGVVLNNINIMRDDYYYYYHSYYSSYYYHPSRDLQAGPSADRPANPAGKA